MSAYEIVRAVLIVGISACPLVAYLFFSIRRPQRRVTPEEALVAFHQRIEDVKHLRIKEAERALGVKGYS